MGKTYRNADDFEKRTKKQTKKKSKPIAKAKYKDIYEEN